MRKKIVAGNWKMNKNLAEAVELFKQIDDRAGISEGISDILIFPPFPFIETLSRIRTHEQIRVGGQNVASEEAGAYTGEVSARMLLSVGASHVLIGHSERRQLFHEKDDVLKKKVDLAIETGLKVILCCGELLNEREVGRHFDVVEGQLNASLFHLRPEMMKEIIVAYEPVWAIGTGVTATTEQAQEMHAFIRNLFRKNFNDEIAGNLPILYGGSCNATNAAELFGCTDIDGGLIGGASLKSDEFLQIIGVIHD